MLHFCVEQVHEYLPRLLARPAETLRVAVIDVVCVQYLVVVRKRTIAGVGGVVGWTNDRIPSGVPCFIDGVYVTNTTEEGQFGVRRDRARRKHSGGGPSSL